MLQLTAWSIIASSFLLIGVFGYVSIDQRLGKKKSANPGRRLFLMIAAAFNSALILCMIAGKMFRRIEIGATEKQGWIDEAQMQPDMPNLIAGIFVVGWAFFLSGVLVARMHRSNDCYDRSEPKVSPGD